VVHLISTPHHYSYPYSSFFHAMHDNVLSTEASDTLYDIVEPDETLYSTSVIHRDLPPLRRSHHPERIIHRTMILNPQFL